MFKFLKKLFGGKSAEVQEKKELLEPQHNVNPVPKTSKPKAPKSPPKPRAKKVEVEVKTDAPKKRGRKPKAK